MNEMVERVARAIISSQWPEADWNNLKSIIPDHHLWITAVGQAKAAIAAMREPPDWMTDAAREAWDWGPGTSLCGDASALRCWQTMIDAALNPAAPSQPE